ncbi:MAG: DNA modification methylase [Firmicutes bacterium]|jgi:DNA modification methylase|nr:DNA modification methylase [Bacillota bacterium]
MEIRRIPVSDINPAPYNPRRDLKPGDPEYERLKKSIAEFDLVEPLVWNEVTGNLVGGHQRLKVLLERGQTEVEVSVVRLDPTREKALNLALNKIQGDWDYPKLKDLLLELDTGALDMEVTGFSEDEIEDLMTRYHVEDNGEPEKFDPVKALQEIVKPRIEPGETWGLGTHRLICGDSTDPAIWDCLLKGGKVDLVVTSPPYNVSIKYATYRDKRARDDYLNLIRSVARNVVAHLRPGRFVAWNIGVSPETYPHHHVVVLEESGLEFYRQIVWEKAGVPYPIFPSTLKARKARHYKPNYKHEVIYVLRQPDEETDLPVIECPVCEGSGHTQGMVNPITHEMLVLMTWGEPEHGGKIKPLRKYANDVWRIMQATATSDLPTLGTKSSGLEKDGKKSHMVKAHPAAFPVELPKAVMTFLTAEGEAVLDPFCEAGATIIAAEQMKRVAYGIEVDPIYCELVIQRWEAATGRKAVRLDGEAAA